jgi:Tol biopolymer transport system component
MCLVLLLASSILVVVPGEVEATPPGDIGRIVFAATIDGPASEIYVREFASSTPVRLTNNADYDYTPEWSPDGTRIAFSRLAGSRTDVWVMDPDGSNQVNLTAGLGTYNAPHDWSPDGTKILFESDRGGTNDIWVMYADGSDPTQLTNDTALEWFASWSPDGSTIAYDRTAAASTHIWLMNPDGSNPRALTSGPYNHSIPAWSPDGTKIAYTSDVGGDDVWVMNADGSNPVNLTNAALYSSWEPSWSPDGSKIAFASDRDGDMDLWVMNPDGTNQLHLTDHPANEWAVDWESVNRNPLAIDDGIFGVHRGQSVEIDVLSNDSDPDGDALSVGDIVQMPAEGSVVINPSGTVTYTHNGMTVPPDHAMPYSDFFEYRLDDARMGSSIGTVRVNIFPYFDDAPQSNLFFDDIVWLATQKITQGCNPPENTLFCPGDFVTRGQMAAFLVRARGYTHGAGANLFVDDDGSVFETVIDQLGTAGVTRGCNPPVNDRYCPNGYVTRGQMAAFLVRAFELPSLGMVDLFVDDNATTFEADIDKLGATGVSRGCNPPDNDRFCPNGYVTRQQMAAFLFRAVTWGED